MRPLGACAAAFAQASLAFLLLAASGRGLIAATPLPDASRFAQRSQIVTDVSGEPLWGFLAADGRWRLLAAPSDVDPRYLRTLIAYEDQRFWSHPGLDVFALARAIKEAVLRGHPKSGGSTLTMQAVRLLEPQPRTFLAKVDQILKALKMERVLSKDDILSVYLTLAPYGGNVDGVRAASLIYFGKEPRHLSFDEAAMLAAIPQAPEERRPDRHLEAAQAAKARLARTLLARGAFDPHAAKLAQAATSVESDRPFAFAAAHFAARMRHASGEGEETIRTLIDAALQKRIETLVSKSIKQWDGAVNIAVVVLRNKDSSVAAYLGGADFGAPANAGFVDLAQAERSPGSALKPFIYSVALEKSIIRPETIMTDQPLEIDGYRPDNADGQFMGDITARQALARSRNTTAVALLKKIGVDEMLGRFRATGRPLVLPEADPSGGLATALGGEGVTLEQLTWFYTAYSREGALGALRFKQDDPSFTRAVLMSKYAARATADILADVPPPAGFERLTANDGARRLGFKTGTSYGFRDAWAIGFDALHTVGVWVGRPDGAAHLGAYGVTAAAPLLMQIFEELPSPPNGIRSVDGEDGASGPGATLPPRLARFDRAAPGAPRQALSIFYPRNGAAIDGGARDGAPAQLTLTVEGGRGPFRWSLPENDEAVTDEPRLTWPFANRGQFDVRVVDANGDVARSSFWLE